ncbi:MAG: tRNA modification GTPase [Archangium sp.]|nr:tRNA modification GTPase [Archangium sp.]
MSSPETATIAAIATGPAAGGIGILRVSGPRARDVLRRVCPSLPVEPTPRFAHLARFIDRLGSVIDEGVALFFAGPNSYTGDDVVELHAHGTPKGLQLLLEAALEVPGVRPAEPGEFTRRAYISGRIDLARAEAVADLIAAESTLAVRAAASQLAGGLSARVEAVRQPLVALHADLEATLDFPDEAEEVEATLPSRLHEALSSVRPLAAAGDSGAVVRRGARVVLYGPVNAGKSTLFNRLVGDARALVDPEPGTTRDTLEARIEWAGLAVTLVDTAGLRASPGRVEALGIERARGAVASADVAVLVVPPDASPADVAAWQAEADSGHRVDVWGKADARSTVPPGLAVSGETGAGVEALRSAVLERLLPAEAGAVAAMSARHVACLRGAQQALERAVAATTHSTLEVVAGEVGVALTALGDITGHDVSTELLDAIFQRFCIGK